MPKVHISEAPVSRGTGYPSPYDTPCRDRVRQRLGDAAGLRQFGVNLLHLPPGAWSSQRHWHESEDEFVWVLEGEVALVTDAGEEILRAGECAGFPAARADGHHFQNRSEREALLLEIGTRAPDEDIVHYPDIDLFLPRGREDYTHKDGRPYGPDPRTTKTHAKRK